MVLLPKEMTILPIGKPGKTYQVRTDARKVFHDWNIMFFQVFGRSDATEPIVSQPMYTVKAQFLTSA